MITAANTSPSFARMILKQIDETGPFTAFKTLMGSNPDQNRRTIQNIITEDRPVTINAEMRVWTPDMEAELDRLLGVLNSDWKAAAHAFRELNTAGKNYSLMMVQSMGITDAKPESMGGGFCTVGDVTVTGAEISAIEGLRALVSNPGEAP
jgi:hypothetical protein